VERLVRWTSSGRSTLFGSAGRRSPNAAAKGAEVALWSNARMRVVEKPELPAEPVRFDFNDFVRTPRETSSYSMG
jgi:hypothetical protein